MQIDVMPIVVPQVNLESFLEISARALGYDPARPADSSSKKITDQNKFLSALACYHDYQNLKRPIGEILQSAASFCAHLSYTMLVSADKDTLFLSMERSGLAHTIADGLQGQRLAVITGTLEQWKRATLECCTQDSSFGLKVLYNKVLLILESLGFKDLWADTRKRSDKSGTFLLEHK